MALITFLNAQLAFGHVALLDHTDFALETAERVGVIGRNGTGKTSFLKILGGLEKADDGTLQLQQNLRLAYVAQEPVLDPEATVFVAASEGISGVRALIDQYCEGVGDLDALQSAIEAQDGWNWEQRVTETLHRLHLDENAIISTLSGGTKKRVALAQALVAQPDVLLLDEPTNDLDIETLELLEELLQSYEGTVFLVSHDRTFLDNVVTSTIACEGNGLWREYEGGVEDWLIQSKRSKEIQAATNSIATSAQQAGSRGQKSNKSADANKTISVQKLSNKAQRELDSLQNTIDSLEKEQALLRSVLTDAHLYEKDPARATELYTRDAAIDEEMLTAMARWEELSGS